MDDTRDVLCILRIHSGAIPDHWPLSWQVRMGVPTSMNSALVLQVYVATAPTPVMVTRPGEMITWPFSGSVRPPQSITAGNKSIPILSRSAHFKVVRYSLSIFCLGPGGIKDSSCSLFCIVSATREHHIIMNEVLYSRVAFCCMIHRYSCSMH